MFCFSLDCFLQFLSDRWLLRLFLFQFYTCIFPECSGHHIHILCFKKHQILRWIHTDIFFQAVINPVFSGHTVKGLDILIGNLNITELCSLLCQLFDSLLSMRLFSLNLLSSFLPSFLLSLSSLLCLFDLDGTLIDSSEGIIKCVLYTLDFYGIKEPDTAKLYRFIGPPLSESFERYYGFSHEKAYEAVQKYRERYNKTGIFECKLYPGVEKCIRTLKEQGYRIGMASSKPEVSCRRILEHFGILPLFDDVVGATFDGTRDKKSEILKEVMRRWSHIPKSEMCLIGDTMFDVNGAKELGIFCIAVSYGFGDVEEMKAAGVAGMCDSLEQLPELLRKLHTCDVHKNR